jgi:hypothetical protein
MQILESEPIDLFFESLRVRRKVRNGFACLNGPPSTLDCGFTKNLKRILDLVGALTLILGFDEYFLDPRRHNLDRLRNQARLAKLLLGGILDFKTQVQHLRNAASDFGTRTVLLLLPAVELGRGFLDLLHGDAYLIDIRGLPTRRFDDFLGPARRLL